MANFENLSSDFQTLAMDIYSQAADLNNNSLHFQAFPPFSNSLDSLLLHHHHQQQQHQEQQLIEIHRDSQENSNDNNNFSSTSTFIHSTENNVQETKKRKALSQTLSSSENSGVSINGTTTQNGCLRRGKRMKKKKKEEDEEEEKERQVVHVRARRGQATDSHSLAERVRRGKINERLKCLQDMVPGCYKSMGMAMMLDEIINYVQSLQSQVEFLSMKLTAASSYYDFNSETDAIDLMQRAKARETVEMGRQTRDGSPVFHL